MTHPDLTLIDHPLVQHKLSLMRDIRTPARNSAACCARSRCF